MKLTRQSVLTASSLIIGGIIGASALVALADNTWVSAPTLTNPVTCDSSINGCNPPINVGSVTQTKAAGLTIQGLLSTNGFLFHPSGTTVPVGSTLVATDTSGTVAWAAPGATTISSYGYVDWVVITQIGQISGTTYPFTQSGCVSGSATGQAFCDGDQPYPSMWFSSYRVNFGCHNPYQLVSYVTSASGNSGSHNVRYRGYCVPALNVINN